MATLINPRIGRFKLWNAVLAKKQASQKPVNIFCSSNGQQVWADSLYRRESPEEEIYKVAGRFDHPGRLAPRLVCLSAGVLLSTLSVSHAVAAETVFDELRFGASGSINTGNSRESGLFPSATIFFDPLSSGTATTWQQSILEPRIYLGASAGTGSGVDQVFGGFSWTADITSRLFVELGLGGTVHNGKLNGGSGKGPELGCRLLFREQVAVGYRVTGIWQILATADHSSHANLCDGPNNGLSHAGLAIGYKF
jgi:lipid A 3-O-deacylase